MWDCEVPNIFVFILCFGWYLLGIKIGKKEVEQDLKDFADNLERVEKKYADSQESEVNNDTDIN